MTPTLVVLAAGIGSRYGGLKQIDPIGPSGEILIDYSVHDALSAGFDKLVFVIRREIESDFRETIGRKYEGRVEVVYTFQELDRLPTGYHTSAERCKPWGTAHAVLTAADAVSEPFAVINADDFYGASAFRLCAQHLVAHERTAPPEYVNVGYVLRHTLSEHGTVARGLLECDDTGLLTRVEEITTIVKDGAGARYTDVAGQAHAMTGDELVSMNFWGFQPSIFPHLQTRFVRFLDETLGDLKAELYIPTVADELVAAGDACIRVLRSTDPWFGVTYREDRPAVVASLRELVRRGVYPERLWS